jgi:hypothetical protein
VTCEEGRTLVTSYSGLPAGVELIIAAQAVRNTTVQDTTNSTQREMNLTGLIIAIFVV